MDMFAEPAPGTAAEADTQQVGPLEHVLAICSAMGGAYNCSFARLVDACK